MAKDRLTLHDELKAVLGSSKVYFQLPASLKLEYPCIIYKRDADNPFYADDKRYLGMKRYLITVVDKDPDSIIPDKMLQFPYCSFTSHYTVDNLNHDVYSLYY